MNKNPLIKIVSGGQSGVDRAALDAALAGGFPCGGWCPKGRKAEDGPIPGTYPLIETEDDSYEQRTRLNVLGSDATLILASGPLSGGSLLAAEIARELSRPSLVVDLGQAPDQAPDPRTAAGWIVGEKIATLNVAGPRESTRPGIYRDALEYLESVLALIRRPS